MKKVNKSKASLLVSALIIFTFISTVLLMLYMYSSNNLKQAKLQEENMHAYFLAYSGCEIAYRALLDEYEDWKKGKTANKWEEFVKEFDDSGVINNHKICITSDTSYKDADFSGYSNTNFVGPMGGTYDPKIVEAFDNSAIFIKVDRVTDSNMLSGESGYKKYIRIESVAKTGISSTFPGLSKKYLYIDTINSGKIYWR